MEVVNPYLGDDLSVAADAYRHWEESRIRAVAQGHVAGNVPFIDKALPGRGNRRFTLVPYAGHSEQEQQSAHDWLVANMSPDKIDVAHLHQGLRQQPDSSQKPVALFLAVRGNPDHGQDPYSPPFGMPNDYFVRLKNLETAKKYVKSYVDRYGAGASNWAGGDLWQDGKRIGTLSHNANFFPSDHEFGIPSPEFRHRFTPDSKDVRQTFVSASGRLTEPLSITPDDDIEFDSALEISNFTSVKSSDQWRIEFCEHMARLGPTVLGACVTCPPYEPISVLVDEDESCTPLDDRSTLFLGAAFIRGDRYIPAIKVQHADCSNRLSL